MRRWLKLVTLLAAFGVASPGAFAAVEDDKDDGGPEEAGTIAATRAPKERSPLKVRQKYFAKKGRLEIAPQVGLVSNNAFNSDFTLGLGLAYHFSERIALEFQAQYGLGGSTAAGTGYLSYLGNQKGLTGAVLQLVGEGGVLLEATDPGLYANAEVLFSPLYGKINPMGLAVINLDFYLALGLGYYNEAVEMVGIDDLSLTLPVREINHLFAINAGLGVKVFVSRSVALRIDGRSYITFDETLDYADPDNASQNRRLDKTEANRLACDDPNSSARCALTVGSSVVVTAGVSVFLPGPKTSRTVAGR